jgi:transcriptional regulator with XRE-family HTH domain
MRTRGHPYPATGRELKSHRVLAGLTQQEMSETTGIPVASYRRYEQGISVPDLQRLVWIREALPSLRVDALMDTLKNEILSGPVT